MAQRTGWSRLEGSVRTGRHQPGAWARAASLCGLFALSACVGSPAEGPGEFFRNAFGEPLQGRSLPPGSDLDYPNLASVPPPPPRGSPSAREALSRALADARSQSRDPVQPGQPLPERPAGTEGSGLIPASPPAPARLSAAPPVGAPSPSVMPDAPGLPEDPGTAAPEPPPAEFLAPAPPRL
ncbi:hypothetical protein [Teichococcus oryzae]|uniref:DUF3035 domain-containing protein n=1 Tax=Teichococcus oryzae TaxID=1608942 RepID=A0A5B2TDS7_9PROT|nr:hypothetical protein [Pseudoroseomonas oryzae]KAA2212641.1 hypothetical protein F0Q34_13060 [Pseudoroseomonas oryzae]